MYVVTGAAGFIGSALVWRLNQAGIEDILVVDRFAGTEVPANLQPLRWADRMGEQEFIRLVQENRLPGEVEAVLHMGACSSTLETDEEYLLRNNVLYTVDLVTWCARHAVRCIYASSAATYGSGDHGFDDDPDRLERLQPLNAYGRSKHETDLRLQRAGLLEHAVGLKFFNVFGPNEYHKGPMRSFALRAFEQISESGRVRLYRSYRDGVADGLQTRDFVYVKDCAEVVWRMLQSGARGLFNVGTGQSRSWLDLARAVFAAMGAQPCVEFTEMPEEMRAAYQYRTEADIRRLRRAGYRRKFQSLEAAVTDYVKFYLAPGFVHLGGALKA